MRFLYLVFAVFLLASLAAPGYGKIWNCAGVGHCAKRCDKTHMKYTSADCKEFCCVPIVWKGK